MPHQCPLLIEGRSHLTLFDLPPCQSVREYNGGESHYHIIYIANSLQTILWLILGVPRPLFLSSKRSHTVHNIDVISMVHSICDYREIISCLLSIKGKSLNDYYNVDAS